MFANKYAESMRSKQVVFRRHPNTKASGIAQCSLRMSRMRQQVLPTPAAS